MDKLEYLLNRQEELFQEIKGKRPIYKEMTTNQFLVLFCDAIIDEASEIKDHLNWKPWKNDKIIDMEEVKEESIDLLHFLLDIFNKLEMNSYEVVERYNTKHQENIDRQIDGGKDGRKEYVNRK